MLPAIHRNKKLLKILGITILSVLAVFALSAFFLLSPGTYYKGVTIGGYDVSGLDRHSARVELERKANEYLKDKRIVLVYGESVWKLSPEDIKLGFEFDRAVNDAFKIGRDGNVFSRFAKVASLRFKKNNVALEPTLEKSKLKKILQSIKKDIDKEGRNAYVIYKNGDIQIFKEEKGRQLDVDINLNLVENHILDNNFEQIELRVDEKKPTILYDNIKEIDSVLSYFATTFNSNDINRTQNLKLSCERINGILLMPGEVFSMNKVLGPRTVENGYKEAKVIYKSEYVNGVGGGVCQISTTLYNAVLKSLLEVVERSHHSLPSLYVGPGQDATIAENYIDFKFKNNRDYPVCISAELKKNRVDIRILGKAEENEYTVKLVPQIVEEYPPEEEDIVIDNVIPDFEEEVVQKPKNGFRVILYREIFNKDGELINREKISDDIYKPTKAKIKVNQNHEKAKAKLVANKQ